MAMRDSDPEDIRPPGPVMSTATITGVSTTPPTSTVQVRLASSPGYRGRSGFRVMVTVGAETAQGMYGECMGKVVSHPKPGYPGKVGGGGGGP